jgi:hypothetical protein
MGINMATESFSKTFKLTNREGLEVLSEVMSCETPKIKRVDIRTAIERSEQLLRQYFNSKDSESK